MKNSSKNRGIFTAPPELFGNAFQRISHLPATLGRVLANLLVIAISRQPRVLIINSNYPDYGWSDGEMHVVLNALNHQYPVEKQPKPYKNF